MRVAITDQKNFITGLEFDANEPTRVTENLSDSVGAVLQRLEIEGHTVEVTTDTDVGTAFAYVQSCRAWERSFLLAISDDAVLPDVPTSLIDEFPTTITNFDLVYFMHSAIERVCSLWLSTTTFAVPGILRKALIGTETVEGEEKEMSLLFQMARIPLSICVSRDTVQATMEGEAPCIKQE